MQPDLTVKFYISGEGFDPATVSAALQMKPTSTWRRGEIRRAGALAKRDTWEWRVGPRLASDFTPLVSELLQAIGSRRSALRDLLETLRAEAEMVCIGEIVDETPTFAFEPHLLRELAELGLTLTMDLVLVASEPPPEG
jgi:hypothetical protein